MSLLASSGSFVVSGTTFRYSRLYPFGGKPLGGEIYEPPVTSGNASTTILAVNRAGPKFDVRRNISPVLVQARSVEPTLIERRQVAPALVQRRSRPPSLGA
jgi:hypothetical protein